MTRYVWFLTLSDSCKLQDVRLVNDLKPMTYNSTIAINDTASEKCRLFESAVLYTVLFGVRKWYQKLYHTGVRAKVRSSSKSEHLKHWKSTVGVGCRQAKRFYVSQKSNLHALFTDLGRAWPTLTGHIAHNRHLTVMKICTDPLWQRDTKQKIPYHFLGKRCANVMVRYSLKA